MIEIALGASNIYRLVRVHIHEEEENPFRGIKVVELRVRSDDVSYNGQYLTSLTERVSEK